MFRPPPPLGERKGVVVAAVIRGLSVKGPAKPRTTCRHTDTDTDRDKQGDCHSHTPPHTHIHT